MQSNSTPVVSFVVPCYKLAHLLAECVQSILSQSYGDFEILIMDDKSPDHTEEVAKSFADPRVRYFRNDPNLGALKNYNHGITLSRGKYVWLISADDYLRDTRVLERYVRLLESNPRVNFTFCPGVSVINGKEVGTLDWSKFGGEDVVVSGRQLLQRLLDYNLILAPAALARRECYEKLSLFPISLDWRGETVDMIWGGDWYLWSLFALHGEVGYFSEPMICYREHELSVTSNLTRVPLEACLRAELWVLWDICRRAEELGFGDVSAKCRRSVAYHYANHLTGKKYRSGLSTMTLAQLDESLRSTIDSGPDRESIRVQTLIDAGDLSYAKAALAEARSFYRHALELNSSLWRVRLKLKLLSLGNFGLRLRRMARILRQKD